MALTTSEAAAVVAMTEAHRADQFARAALLATLVSRYYESQVRWDDSSLVERWLGLMVPQILKFRSQSATLAAAYGDAIRRLELGEDDGFRFDPLGEVDPDVVRSSLFFQGVKQVQDKVATIRQLDESVVDPGVKQALIDDARRGAAEAIRGSVVRHVQNGGRDTIQEGARRDQKALGWVRVTDSDPCYFCAMLASRGIEYNPYTEDSFKASDARFDGPGSAKVHDNCGCGMKPVYTSADPIVDRSKEFETLWREFSKGSGKKAIKSFRQGYEGRSASE